jgi:hypothetical protein
MSKSNKNAFSRERSLFDDLKRVKKKLSGRDVDAIDLAIQELERCDGIRGELASLNSELIEIDKLHALEGVTEHERGKLELVASAASLKEVRNFLSIIAPSHSLMLLGNALTDLLEGGTVPAMLTPLNEFTNRPPDSPQIMAIKGALAGVMRTLQDAGTSREAAANLIARNLSPELATRISRKPITARTVEEWVDRFGGDHVEENSGRRAYRTWSRGKAPSSQKIREITERMAKTLPVRKPS